MRQRIQIRQRRRSGGGGGRRRCLRFHCCCRCRGQLSLRCRRRCRCCLFFRFLEKRVRLLSCLANLLSCLALTHPPLVAAEAHTGSELETNRPLYFTVRAQPFALRIGIEDILAG